VQRVPLGDRERASEQHPEHACDHDVGVHDRVCVGTGVLREQDALPDAGAAADQLGDDGHDERDGGRDAQPGGDVRRRARHDHRGELARTADLKHARGIAHHRVERPDAVADLDDQRPEHGERDERELHRERRAPQHQGDRQDRDHRDGLEELDHADHAAVGEAGQSDERADEQRGRDPDCQADRPAFQGLADRRPQRPVGRLVPQGARGLRHRGELIGADDPRHAQPLPEAKRGGEHREPQPVPEREPAHGHGLQIIDEGSGTEEMIPKSFI
jgi:hypothetical protein